MRRHVWPAVGQLHNCGVSCSFGDSAELGVRLGQTGDGVESLEGGCRKGKGLEGCKADLTEGRSFWKSSQLPLSQPVLECWARHWPMLCKDGCLQAKLTSSLFTRPLPSVSLSLAGMDGPCHPLP